MIEFCNKRRMLIAIALLTLISVVVLFVENTLSLRHEMKDTTKAPGNLSKVCWEMEGVKVEMKEECAPCSKFAVKAKSPEACVETGYKETVTCSFKNGTNTDVYRSCPKLSWLEERNFWLFEALATLVGLGSYAIVCVRQKRLDQMLLEKVHKQIAAGI